MSIGPGIISGAIPDATNPPALSLYTMVSPKETPLRVIFMLLGVKDVQEPEPVTTLDATFTKTCRAVASGEETETFRLTLRRLGELVDSTELDSVVV
jgi:hypothetical protein